MATNITKTEHFTSGAGNPISFSQIQAEYGGSATNIKASNYKRNLQDNIDWNGEDGDDIVPRIPDAVENENVVTTNENWTVDSLRDTISEYIVTQTGTDLEVAYSDDDTVTWNGNLSRNILKKFDVTGTIYADSVNDDALSFNGNLYNLEIEVDELGEIYGEGGAIDGDGGDALYVNNTYTKSKVQVRSYGKIWSGGGGGTGGSKGDDGSNLNCFVNKNWNYSAGGEPNRNWYGAVNSSGCVNRRPAGVPSNNVSMYAVNPNDVRSRCRGGGARRGEGWRSANWSGYQCATNWTAYCKGIQPNTVTGATGGNGGGGGKGKGYSNINVAINASPHIGNDGNSGVTITCSANRTSSSGKKGNPGKSGGDWGEDSSGGKSGSAIKKKNAVVEYYTDDTLKGKITNI